MFDKSFQRMVNVMPIQNSVSAFRTAPRVLTAALASAFLFICHASTVHAAAEDAASDDILSTIFSTYGIAIILVLVVAALIVFKKVNGARTKRLVAEPQPERRSSRFDTHNSAAATTREPMIEERRMQSLQPAQQWEKPSTVEPSVFGAYRIDQEVCKLVLGKPHRMDVMASRATDDRRAIEASLIKALEASDTSEDGRRRARTALEEYGFIARQSATMLMGRDAWERSSAARTLGQIGSEASLSFLIEALHDADTVVRNQAISSLGALKMPAAIGALLDIARRHPDIPASLLSETLSSCSVESFGYLDSPSTDPVLLADGANAAEVGHESLVNFEDLPAGTEDQALANLLAQLDSTDDDVRTQVAQQLGFHPVQCAVAALYVARACIKIGIVSQTADRLASEDRRQAYEAFSLFSLLAKAHETEPILETIRNHNDIEVRLCAVRVLSVAGEPDVAPKLRELVAVEGMPEKLRTAMLEVLYKLDQKQTVFELTPSDNDAVTLHNSL